MKITDEQRFGIISTAIFLSLFASLLLIFGFTSPFPPPEEEGILINFGTDETGSGLIEPRPVEQPTVEKSVPEPVKTPPPTTHTEAKEDIETQDFDKTAVLEEKKRKEKELEEQIEKQKQQEIERKKREQEELLKKQEEERKRKEEQQKLINKRAQNAFGGKNPNGDNTGEGDGSSNGNQGSPDGSIDTKNRTGGQTGANGIAFNLSGRSHRSLPAPPKIHNTEGRVVVEVTVDQNGNVISARAGVKGTTIADENLWRVAKEAALKATFDVNKKAPVLQKGTITYFFGYSDSN